MTAPKDWIVMEGQPVDTTHGGGFEFFGPFTEEEAQEVRKDMVEKLQHMDRQPFTLTVTAIQLLHYRFVSKDRRVISRGRQHKR